MMASLNTVAKMSLKKKTQARVLYGRSNRSNMSNNSRSFSQSMISKAVHRKRFRSLLHNNKTLAKTLEYTQCDLQFKEKMICNLQQELNHHMVLRLKVKEMSKTMNKLFSEVEDIMRYLDCEVVDAPAERPMVPRKSFMQDLQSTLSEQSEPDNENTSSQAALVSFAKKTSLPDVIRETPKRQSISLIKQRLEAQNMERRLGVCDLTAINEVSLVADDPTLPPLLFVDDSAKEPITCEMSKKSSRKRSEKPTSIHSEGRTPELKITSAYHTSQPSHEKSGPRSSRKSCRNSSCERLSDSNFKVPSFVTSSKIPKKIKSPEATSELPRKLKSSKKSSHSAEENQHISVAGGKNIEPNADNRRDTFVVSSVNDAVVKNVEMENNRMTFVVRDPSHSNAKNSEVALLIHDKSKSMNASSRKEHLLDDSKCAKEKLVNPKKRTNTLTESNPESSTKFLVNNSPDKEVAKKLSRATFVIHNPETKITNAANTTTITDNPIVKNTDIDIRRATFVKPLSKPTTTPAIDSTYTSQEDQVCVDNRVQANEAQSSKSSRKEIALANMTVLLPEDMELTEVLNFIPPNVTKDVAPVGNLYNNSQYDESTEILHYDPLNLPFVAEQQSSAHSSPTEIMHYDFLHLPYVTKEQSSVPVPIDHLISSASAEDKSSPICKQHQISTPVVIRLRSDCQDVAEAESKQNEDQPRANQHSDAFVGKYLVNIESLSIDKQKDNQPMPNQHSEVSVNKDKSLSGNNNQEQPFTNQDARVVGNVKSLSMSKKQESSKKKTSVLKESIEGSNKIVKVKDKSSIKGKRSSNASDRKSSKSTKDVTESQPNVSVASSRSSTRIRCRQKKSFAFTLSSDSEVIISSDSESDSSFSFSMGPKFEKPPAEKKSRGEVPKKVFFSSKQKNLILQVEEETVSSKEDEHKNEKIEPKNTAINKRKSVQSKTTSKRIKLSDTENSDADDFYPPVKKEENKTKKSSSVKQKRSSSKKTDTIENHLHAESSEKLKAKSLGKAKTELAKDKSSLKNRHVEKVPFTFSDAALDMGKLETMAQSVKVNAKSDAAAPNEVSEDNVQASEAVLAPAASKADLGKKIKSNDKKSAVKEPKEKKAPVEDIEKAEKQKRIDSKKLQKAQGQSNKKISKASLNINNDKENKIGGSTLIVHAEINRQIPNSEFVSEKPAKTVNPPGMQPVVILRDSFVSIKNVLSNDTELISNATSGGDVSSDDELFSLKQKTLPVDMKSSSSRCNYRSSEVSSRGNSIDSNSSDLKLGRRSRSSQVSYKEPKLNVKMRR